MIQVNLICFWFLEQADMILWNLSEAKRLLDAGRVMIGSSCLVQRLRQHLTKVQAVAFSNRDDFLASLGSQDDNALVIWDVASGEAICGSPAGPDSALTCEWLHGRNDRLVTAGFYHVKVWQVDFSLPKLHAMDARLSNVRRVFTSVVIQPDDEFAYFGTTTGDVFKVKIDRDEVRSHSDPDSTIPTMITCSKERLTGGVLALCCLVNSSNGKLNIVAGAGDGTIIYLSNKLEYVVGYKTQLKGGVTSIALHPNGNKFIVGTDQCNRYELSKDLQEAVLKMSCHSGAVNDVAFPEGCADLIVSSSRGDIRVWNTKQKQELLRIQVPNLECLSSLVTPSGAAIVSGWDDGKIRAFYPETGRMKFVIPNAHTERVTALAIADNDARTPWRIISGGHEGRVRIWNCTSSHQVMVESLKEHRGPINALKVNRDGTQCISASSDGSCIVWDLVRYVRLTALFEPNVFESVLYHPDESQILTCGTNHKITYWDSVDSDAIRVIDGGDGFMTSLDIEPEGEFFVSGSEDRLVKVWSYDEGLPVAVGRGHTGIIKAVKFSPDLKCVVSVASTGEIIFWELPKFSDLREVVPADLH
jgi:cilia- and flagella-associated protein 52